MATQRTPVQRRVQRSARDRVAGSRGRTSEYRGTGAELRGAEPRALHTGSALAPSPDPAMPATMQTCRCGAPITGQRCAKGHQAPRTKGLHYIHGGCAESSLESLEALGAIAEKRAALRAHLGGQPSVVQADLSADYCRLDVLIETAAANIARQGAMTARGRTRSAVALLLQLMDRRLRLAVQLGIEPRTKRVSVPSAREWVAGAEMERGEEAVCGQQ